MTIDDILKWIALKNMQIFEIQKNGYKNIEQFHELIGAHKILEDLRFHILIETNPHNRKDIEEFKRKRDAI